MEEELHTHEHIDAKRRETDAPQTIGDARLDIARTRARMSETIAAFGHETVEHPLAGAIGIQFKHRPITARAADCAGAPCGRGPIQSAIHALKQRRLRTLWIASDEAENI